jgi:hypothetical protein
MIALVIVSLSLIYVFVNTFGNLVLTIIDINDAGTTNLIGAIMAVVTFFIFAFFMIVPSVTTVARKKQ